MVNFLNIVSTALGKSLMIVFSFLSFLSWASVQVNSLLMFDESWIFHCKCLWVDSMKFKGDFFLLLLHLRFLWVQLSTFVSKFLVIKVTVKVQGFVKKLHNPLLLSSLNQGEKKMYNRLSLVNPSFFFSFTFIHSYLQLLLLVLLMLEDRKREIFFLMFIKRSIKRFTSN